MHSNSMYVLQGHSMEEGAFKRKKDILSSYNTKSIFYLSSTTNRKIVPQEIQEVFVLTFIYGLPGLAVYV